MAEENTAPVEDTNEQTEKQDNLPPFKVDVEDAGTLKKKVIVTIPAERIDAKRSEMFGELSDKAQVPGFRIGHAPRRLIEKRFGKEIATDVRNSLIGEALGKAIEDTDLKTIGEPDLDLEKIELPDSGDMTFSMEVEVMPEFELPQLTGIAVDKKPVEITPDRVDEQIEQWRSAQAHFEETDQPAAENDVVLASAAISGEGIEKIERTGLTLRVAPGQVEGLPLVDLGQQLAGKKAGQTVTVTVKAPESHPNEQWREKDLTVELSIGTVRARQLPELNDDLATKAGFDNLEDLRKYIGERLASKAVVETQQAMREQIQKYLLDNTSFDLPEGVVKRHTASVLRRRYIDLLSMGMPRETIDENITRLQAAAGEQAKQDLKLQFILGKIADEQEIEADDGEVNSRVAAMAQEYNRRPERLRQELESEGQINQVRQAIVEQKVLDKLLADANITEAAAEPAGQEKKPAKKASKKAKSDDASADKE